MKRPQFIIRDLFWLAIVVALACGLWSERRKGISDRSELRALKDELQTLKETVRAQPDREGHLLSSIANQMPEGFELAHTVQGWELRKLGPQP